MIAITNYVTSDTVDYEFCKAPKAVRLFQELDDKKGVGLITQKRLRLGKSSVIYVKSPVFEIKRRSPTFGKQNQRYRNIGKSKP